MISYLARKSSEVGSNTGGGVRYEGLERMERGEKEGRRGQEKEGGDERRIQGT